MAEEHTFCESVSVRVTPYFESLFGDLLFPLVDIYRTSRQPFRDTFGAVLTAIGPPLWSSGQSFWLQIRRPGFDSRHYQKKVVGLERGPLSLVSEDLLDRKSSGSCLENREHGRRDPSRWPRGTLYPQKVGKSLRQQAAVDRSV
jgi:hypothetical protein